MQTSGKATRSGLSTVYYLGASKAALSTSDSGKATTFTIDFDRHTVEGTTSISGDYGTMMIGFTGTIDPLTGRVYGTLNQNVTGTFEGAFYGPGGRELALMFNGGNVIGYAVVQ
ncbi:transferrin-binding protein-like solute binding protein [Sphingomonas sp. GC_Shp_3]|uniref:transferrin-binding protein-like solute binding protein n=1 Tax=Sphingomonas sp. GC_Shp_3 TaxID=2937383 RepID=UPI002269A377|nr:transferrin-binding protein-like solute binding protein [Sphingomonas sp. GC_Shp_3]